MLIEIQSEAAYATHAPYRNSISSMTCQNANFVASGGTAAVPLNATKLAQKRLSVFSLTGHFEKDKGLLYENQCLNTVIVTDLPAIRKHQQQEHSQ